MQKQKPMSMTNIKQKRLKIIGMVMNGDYEKVENSVRGSTGLLVQHRTFLRTKNLPSDECNFL